MKISALIPIALGAFASSLFGATPSSALNLRQMLVPAGKAGRHIEFPMRAKYITIHSTQNPGATQCELQKN